MAGTTRSSMLGFIAWEAEDSFADAADDTYTARVQIRDDQIDVSGLQRPLVARGGTFQRLNEGDPDVPGAFGVGSFSFSMDLYGHGSATNGALTATPLLNLLAHAMGNASSAQVGGLLTTGTNDVDTLTSTNTTLLAGGLIRVGALGDGRAEGQPAVAADADSDYELLTALPGAPTTSDAVRAMLLAYPVSSSASSLLTSDGSTSNNTLRFVLATANQQYVCRGCACTGIAISGLTPGEIPRITFTFGTVVWAPVAQTFPSTTATADFAPAPSANGSLFIQDAGTVTRNTDVPREFAVTIGQGMTPIVGQGGASTAQSVTGWARVPAKTTLSITIEAQAASSTPTWYDYFGTDPNSITLKHILYGANVTDGRAVALYFPRCKPISAVPTQNAVDGLNYVTLEFEALTNTVTTSELTLANMVLGMG